MSDDVRCALCQNQAWHLRSGASRKRARGTLPVMTPGVENEPRTARPGDRVRGVSAGCGPVVTPVAPAGAPRPSRSLEERFIVSFPSFYRVATALLLGLVRPQTRARRHFLRHAVASGWAAVQRRDFELMLVRYAPSVVYDADAGLQALGVPGSARGRAEMASVLGEILDVFDRFELAPACTARRVASS
jgi:hypothetical protein